jgi:hypothetical protein
MELARRFSHGIAESVLFERGLDGMYAEVRETIRAARVELGLAGATSELRAVRERILRQLAGHGWEIDTGIFPASAPTRIQRGHYRLDASKRLGAGAALGIICHFGSAEFTVRKRMLVSEAVRRGIVDCGLVALITRDARPYLAGRSACYEQALRFLRAYGQSGFAGIPIILWGLAPEATQLEFAPATGRRAEKW